MAYRIKIEKVDYQMQEKRGSYGCMKTEYISGYDYDQLSYEERKNWKRVEDVGEMRQYERSIYGYPTYRESTEEITKVYEQVVDSLDMRAVINAVNSPPAQVPIPRVLKDMPPEVGSPPPCQ